MDEVASIGNEPEASEPEGNAPSDPTNDPLSFADTVKASKNGSRGGIVEEVKPDNGDPNHPGPGALYGLMLTGAEKTAQAVVSAIGSGGDFKIYQQLINTTYQGTLGSLYDARLFSGRLPDGSTWERNGNPVTVQHTILEEILEAVKGK